MRLLQKSFMILEYLLITKDLIADIFIDYSIHSHNNILWLMLFDIKANSGSLHVAVWLLPKKNLSVKLIRLQTLTM